MNVVELQVGLSDLEWNDLESDFQHQPPNDLKFVALWSRTIKNKKLSFDGLKNTLEKVGLKSHLLCGVNIFFNFHIDDVSGNQTNVEHRKKKARLTHNINSH